MSLSGNLGFVSLDEVLRLLTRSGQRGSVTVRGEGIGGRVFVTKGGITLATTTDDVGLEKLLRKSGVVEPKEVDGGGSLDKDDPDLVSLLREITVESIYRLNLHGDTFDVTEGDEARFASPRPFELEQLLEDSRKRLEDWAEVSQVVSDLDTQIHFVRDLGEREEVTIRSDGWRVLGEVGSGASVSQIADELGTTEFWAARVVARLVGEALLRTDAGPEPIAPPADTSWDYDQPEADVGLEGEFEEPVGEEIFREAPEERSVSPFATEEPSPVSDDLDDETSWWEEPQPEPVDVGHDSEDAEEGDVEEDTEAFLEKVFSELDESDEEGDPAGEGFGLLRRRRLGAMRDMPRDS